MDRGLGVEISEGTWNTALFRVKGTSCTGLDVIQVNVLHRLHYSNVKLSSIYTSVTVSVVALLQKVKSVKGTMSRAEILLTALKDLMDTLFSLPKDRNLICTVKLLKTSVFHWLNMMFFGEREDEKNTGREDEKNTGREDEKNIRREDEKNIRNCIVSESLLSCSLGCRSSLEQQAVKKCGDWR
ncbi:polyadenylate-binding protein-interacting protein 1 [Silurus meridionalis]|nr:polyadenylate-binding protein-interacting protein 1 [Silurus meridionalis]